MRLKSREPIASITIHDIAQRVGVSSKTVSRAMNNHPGVSAETRAVVLQAIEELNFRPNATARGLRKGRSGIIGVCVPDLLNPHYAQYACSLQEIANDANYMLVVSNTTYDQQLSLDRLRILIDHRVDAVIWFSGVLDYQLIDLIRGRQLPTVIVDAIPPEGINHVRSLFSNEARNQVTYDVTSELIQLGHTRLAYISEGAAHLNEFGRIMAFRKAVQDHGLPESAALVKSSSKSLRLSSVENGYQAMNEVLSNGFQPTAVCSSDILAIGVLRALHEHGLHVPTDVSIVGCDDIPQAASTDPALTTIHTPHMAMSQAMLRLVLQMIEPEAVEKLGEETKIEYTLVRRASMGPASSHPDQIEA